MPKLKPLTRLPTFDPDTGDLVVFVETPRHSRSKYAYNANVGAFDLKFVLPEGMTFPLDFGFIPSTLGQDGDPLDILLLLDEPVAVGTRTKTRLVGAIRAYEREGSGRWERNDRLIAVAVHAHAHEHIRAIADMNPQVLADVEVFFESYNRLHGKEFRVKDHVNAKKAGKLLKKGLAAYQRR
ncbi:inorganic diphosphatase [Microvirga puerhi]|uniref:inorganic diphosphatase n=1 Tax=Microvirga puerhi TaxID=2876078 RepID=A0ABS7VLM0_9HYPH|nr:inorganic diphosphatase [Microvirga puerhi]MBZ6075897.1 inorganic diphosphatase [Microvirga puerhi]